MCGGDGLFKFFAFKLIDIHIAISRHWEHIIWHLVYIYIVCLMGLFFITQYLGKRKWSWENPVSVLTSTSRHAPSSEPGREVNLLLEITKMNIFIWIDQIIGTFLY